MQALPVGVPKLIISTMASGNVRPYVGAADIAMMNSVTDIQGLNRVSRTVLANGANAMAGMARGRLQGMGLAETADKPAMAMTMFGVTTALVQRLQIQLEADWECLVFHATGIGGQSMEKLIDSGFVSGVIDATTTEIADFMMGGILPASEDRFGAVIRTGIPYIGSVGALDMVNFGAPETIPARYASRQFHRHNPQVTLMRTTPEENLQMGQFIGKKLNLMSGPVRFFLPEGGISALDGPGQPFEDQGARAELFRSLERTVSATPERQLIRLPFHINDPEFADAMARAFQTLHPLPHRKPAP
jgi:uncharacterized protein (UPF0261 family)